jgi:hypothetical protein
LLSLGLHEGRPSYRRSLQPSEENIKQETSLFSISVGHFCAFDPDPDPAGKKTNADLRGSGSTTLKIIRELYCRIQFIMQLALNCMEDGLYSTATQINNKQAAKIHEWSYLYINRPVSIMAM